MISKVAMLLRNLSWCISAAPSLLVQEVQLASHLKKNLGVSPFSLPFLHLTVLLLPAWMLPFAYRQRYTEISVIVLRCLWDFGASHLPIWQRSHGDVLISWLWEISWKPCTSLYSSTLWNCRLLNKIEVCWGCALAAWHTNNKAH